MVESRPVRIALVGDPRAEVPAHRAIPIALQMAARRVGVAALDRQDDVRAVELNAHPFFVATLFQPERAVLHGRPAPLAQAFLAACCR